MEQETVVRKCDAKNCVWNLDGKCSARQISILVTRYGSMSCWNYMDIRQRKEETEG